MTELKFRILAPAFLCVTPVHLFILCVHLYLFILCGAWKRGMIFCSFLPLCLFDMPYMEGRGETKFWDFPQEPLWVGPGPRCESEVTAPPDFKLRDFSHPQPVDTKVFPSSASIAQQLSD